MVLDAERVAARMAEPCPTDPRHYLLAFFPDAEIPLLSRRRATAVPLRARVNHGQWLVSCDCGSRGLPAPGMAVWLSEPWAWCIRCRNRAVGGNWRPIALPPDEVRASIEAVLTLRPAIADRNWEPIETVADLVAENLEQGDPIPEGV